MKKRPFAVVAAALVLGLAATGSADLVLDPLAGNNALENYYGTDPFDPNYTSPQLQITGSGSVENTGGVAVFDHTEFTLDIQFLGAYTNESKRSFEDLFLTAAFQPGGASFDRIRFFDPDEPSHFYDLSFSSFIDSQDFGLPFPPDTTIRGMSVGEADFLSLDGALMGGVELGVGLERDGQATVPPTVSVGVQIFAPDPGSKVRFDVFGLNDTSSHGWLVKGNNPNSGSGGVVPSCPSLPPPPPPAIPEPATALIFLSGAAALTVIRRRRRMSHSAS